MFTLHSEMFSSLSVAPMISIGEELWPPLSTVDLGSANVNPFTLFLMGNFPRASPSLVNWLCQDGNYLASSSLGIIPLMRSCGHETPWWQGVNCLSLALAIHLIPYDREKHLMWRRKQQYWRFFGGRIEYWIVGMFFFHTLVTTITKIKIH